MMECLTTKTTMKNHFKLLLVTTIILTLGLSGCYNDNEEDLYLGSNSCDTNNVTYTTTVAPIFATYCNSCHSGGSPSGNILTDSYNSLVTNMSRIRGCINHEPGYSQMPQGGNKLSTCELSKIDAWIHLGMPNN
jgi:hypothetical protein